MDKNGNLNESSTKKEIESRFNNARKVMDDLCVAFYGMTWAEHERLHGRCPEEGDKQ